MGVPGWVDPYVGIPFKEMGRDRDGVDCWGLVYLVMGERYGIVVPSYHERYQNTADRAELETLIHGEMGPWREVPAGTEREGDVALLRIMGRDSHVGLVADRGYMLHAELAPQTVCERYDTSAWRRRIVGFYRWEGVA